MTNIEKIKAELEEIEQTLKTWQRPRALLRRKPAPMS